VFSEDSRLECEAFLTMVKDTEKRLTSKREELWIEYLGGDFKEY